MRRGPTSATPPRFYLEEKIPCRGASRQSSPGSYRHRRAAAEGGAAELAAARLDELRRQGERRSGMKYINNE
ncbi:hypothetical protein WMF38_36555 [Sorangium sp. So ce118]